jgi:uncharacterized protein YdhG (YjbR/CyaY superfamily)
VVGIARRVAPEAVEGTSYGVPALLVDGKGLLGVRAAGAQLSLVPFSSGAVDAVRDDLAGWSASKGLIRFTVDTPLPDDVVERVVRARLAEIRAPRSRPRREA